MHEPLHKLFIFLYVNAAEVQHKVPLILIINEDYLWIFLFYFFFPEPNNKRGSAVFQRYSFKDDFLFTFLYTPFNDFCAVTQKISLPLIRNTIYPNQKQ